MYVVLASVAAVVVVGGTGAFLVTRALHAVNNPERLMAEASSLCSRGGYGSFGSLLPAQEAVARLKGAGMSTRPWDALPANALIVQCYWGGAANEPGTFLDACGRHTPAPPVPTCQPGPPPTILPSGQVITWSCRVEAYAVSGSMHISGC